MQPCLARHDDIVRLAVENNGGAVVKLTGDGVHAAFSSAVNAVAASLEMQTTLSRATWELKEPIRVRIGLHTGESEIRQHDYYGTAVNRAARIMAAGHGGQILLSSTTREVVGRELPDRANLHDLGKHRLKDLIEAETLYQLQHPDLSDTFPPLRSLESSPNNLPAQITEFVGRAESLLEAAALLEDGRLLTLFGSGGVGKTRLALQIGAEQLSRFRDGVWFVELAALVSGALVAKEIAVALSIGEQANESIEETLLTSIESAEQLLILDNCEHLIEDVARLCESLLKRCPNIRILATSREKLGIVGEQTFDLPPLRYPERGVELNGSALEEFEAIRLFVERARSADPTFSLSETNSPYCVDICRRLDGIPLAMELAAARAGMLSLQQIAERLDNVFGLLKRGSRTAMPRQQTLLAAMDWSYDLLTPEEKALFRQLAPFRGGFALDAVETVSGAMEAVDLLEELVNKSMVTVVHREDRTRYQLREPVREYAWKKLNEEGNAQETISNFADYMASYAEEHGRRVQGSGQLSALQALDDEHDNMRSVVENSLSGGRSEPALRIAAALSHYWFLRCHYGESDAWFRHLVAERAHTTPRNAAKLLMGAGEFAFRTGRYADAHEWIGAARELARDAGQLRLEGWALSGLATNAYYRGEPEQLLGFADDAQAIFDGLADRHGFAYTVFLKTSARYPPLWGGSAPSGEICDALVSAIDNVLPGAREVGERNVLAHLVELRALIARDRGNAQESKALFEEAVEAFGQLGNRGCMAHCLDNVAGLALRDGHSGRALRLLAATETERTRLGVPANSPDQRRFTTLLDRLKNALPLEQYETSWESGIKLSLDDAIELAKKTLTV
jgi:predicted ATPase